MELILKAAGICITAAFIGAVIKKDAPAMTLMLACGAVTAALFLVLNAVGTVKDLMDELADKADVDTAVISTLLKVTGIALITRAASDICADAGMKAAATGVDIAGSTAALFTSVPLIRSVCKMIFSLL